MLTLIKKKKKYTTNYKYFTLGISFANHSLMNNNNKKKHLCIYMRPK